VRRTPVSARGDVPLWGTGAALVVCLAMVAGLVALIGWQAGRAFWPGVVERVTLRGEGASAAEVFIGLPEMEERGEDGRVTRRRYRVGNRDLGQDGFRWVEVSAIEKVEKPEGVVLLERKDWGIFLGVPERVVRLGADGGEEELASGLGEGGPAARERLDELVRAARGRAREIERLSLGEGPRVQRGLRGIEWERRRIAREMGPSGAGVAGGGRSVLGWLGWAAVGLGGLSAVGFARVVGRVDGRGGGRWAILLWVLAGVAGLGLVLERPWAGGMSEREGERRLARLVEREGELARRGEEIRGRIAVLKQEDARTRVLVRDVRTGRMAPESVSAIGDGAGSALVLSQVTRVVWLNELGWWGRAGVYLGRWRDFVSSTPQPGTGEGGVFPVIVGTVVLTLLLVVSVVPLGVVAALYLREYARQGVVTSVIRVAINNLAGVPSIVYGMFGLGFFCYAVGGFVDAGPASWGGEGAVSRGAWWLGVVGAGVLAGLGVVCAGLSVRSPTVRASAVQRWAGIGSVVCWGGAVVGAGALVWTTPYFGGFFAERLPESPTFGGRGILWAALTLALLTLPVVIVATEEAIAAVPNSMRQGSLACGASRWETIRRIVLPSAMPGVMTGAILAMARGAGEVAPLMLVGAVNFAPALPVSGDAPFLHGERTFMHLGFHIYSLGFQSADAEAARPLVWATAGVLIVIVVMLNVAAVGLRTRLRRQLGGAAI
jgi:ABC-type phosphate transport system permease subunit